MKQARKQLKIWSIVVLIFAAATLLSLASELMFGDLNNATIPEGAPDNILLITKTILLVFSLVLLIPQIYVGVKGLRIAASPDSSKGHILWAIILLVATALTLITPAIDIFKGVNVYGNATDVLGILVEIFVYVDYIKYAKAVLNEG